MPKFDHYRINIQWFSCCTIACTLLIFIIFLVSSASARAASATLDDIRKRDALKCGVNPDLPGFSTANSLNEYSGFDTDLCRSVAAAALGDAGKVEFIPVSVDERFNLLQDGTIDVLIRNITYTLTRNARYGQFTGISLFDGQGFMVPKRTGIQNLQELDNVPVCFTSGGTNEKNLQRFFNLSAMRHITKPYANDIDALDGYAAGDCQAVSADRTVLAAGRMSLANPDAHALLSGTISKQPLGPVVRNDDIDWAKVVSWSLHCLVSAEELGLNSENLAQQAQQDMPEIRQIMGNEDGPAGLLGLQANWCANIIEQVGNYAEIYARNLGSGSPIDLDRGINRLWTNGGLLYALPLR